MTYTPIGVIREELRAGLGSVEAMFDGYFVDGVAHHALIEIDFDHSVECAVCRGVRSGFPGPRPPFAWAGGAR